MLTTSQAFDKFRMRLELSATEQRDAARRQQELRDCIRGGFDVKTDFLSGSYARDTKTKPLKDVDVFFVLGATEKGRRNQPPAQVLTAFETHLKKTYSSVACNRRSVTVEFEKAWYPEDHEGKVLSIDAVPAFECSGGDYEIPDNVEGKWIKTNPSKHRDKATAKNARLDGRWVPLVKMLKAWNRFNGKPIKPSFLIEVMALNLVDPPFSSYPDEIRNFLSAAESAIARPWPDPAGLGPPVSDQMTPQLISAARAALREAQRKAALAARAEQTGRQGDALQLWREVLGDYFPLS